MGSEFLLYRVILLKDATRHIFPQAAWHTVERKTLGTETSRHPCDVFCLYFPRFLWYNAWLVKSENEINHTLFFKWPLAKIRERGFKGKRVMFDKIYTIKLHLSFCSCWLLMMSRLCLNRGTQNTFCCKCTPFGIYKSWSLQAIKIHMCLYERMILILCYFCYFHSLYKRLTLICKWWSLQNNNFYTLWFLLFSQSIWWVLIIV